MVNITLIERFRKEHLFDNSVSDSDVLGETLLRIVINLSPEGKGENNNVDDESRSDILKIIQAGGDINHIDDRRRNAAWWAVTADNYEVLRVLIVNNISLDYLDCHGISLIEYAESLLDDGIVSGEIVDLLRSSINPK